MFSDEVRFMKKIAIIGAGASGLSACVSAVRKNADVTVFERNLKPGKKILMTGNGKCNLSNTEMSADMYYTSDREFITRTFSRFGLYDTVMFFNSLGLLLTEKRSGIYPHSEQASSVLDALYLEALSGGARFKTSAFVKRIEKSREGFNVIYCENDSKNDSKKESTEYFDRVIVSCGGKAAPATGSDGNGYELVKRLGHSLTGLYPALCGVRCKGDHWKGIAGVRCQAGLIIENDNTGEGVSFGELQITDYGISGIPVFQISRLIAVMLDETGKCSIDIDLIPDVDESSLLGELSARVMILPDRSCEQILNGILNKKLSVFLLKSLGIGLTEKFSDNDGYLRRVVDGIKHFRVSALKMNSFEQAQTTAGGVPLAEIGDNFESKMVPGLFLTGEILDADGVCGGYNLQWAWSSGVIAGEEAALC